MSPALPVVSGQETVAALKKIGFTEIGQRGSHVPLEHRNRVVHIVWPKVHRVVAPPSKVLPQSAARTNSLDVVTTSTVGSVRWVTSDLPDP